MSGHQRVPEEMTIALVLDPSFGTRIEALAKKMPVWIVESKVNTEAVNKIRECSSNFFEVTVFFRRAGESNKEQFVRALYGLDEHHGEASIPGGYNNLLIYSISPAEIDWQVLKELEFGNIRQTGFGWEAHKD